MTRQQEHQVDVKRLNHSSFRAECSCGETSKRTTSAKAWEWAWDHKLRIGGDTSTGVIHKVTVPTAPNGHSKVRAKCRCGWKSEPMRDVYADAEGYRHEAENRPPIISEPVDPRREAAAEALL